MSGTLLSRRGAVLTLVAATAACATPVTVESASPVMAEALQPLVRFIGSWRGRGSGEPGDSQVERSYTPVLGGRFIEARNRSVYAPQQKNPTGETHEDVGYISFDRARRRFVFRQFHVEGFVNQFVSTTAAFDRDELVMESEAIENIGPGWRARETYRFAGADAFEEIFELAEPGKAFAVYSHNRLARS